MSSPYERAALERRLRGSNPIPSRPGRARSSRRQPASELAQLPEDRFLEHKQTFAFNIHTKKKDAALSDAVLDRVCSFWNTESGTLLIGVEDRTGSIVGLADDLKLFKDVDGLVSHISHKLHRGCS